MPELFNLNSPPFDRLTEKEQEKLVAALDIAYFKEGEVLLKTGSKPTHLYILIKGSVAEIQDGETVAFYTGDDHFDANAIFEGESQSSFHVEEEVVAYQLPEKQFLEIARRNEHFRSFYSENLSQKLMANNDNDNIADLLSTPIGNAFLNPPITVSATAPLAQAARLMKEYHINTILVEHDNGKTGIVTTSQLRDAALIDAMPIDTPVDDLAVYNTIDTQPDQPLSQAMMLMSKHRIRRVLVRDEENVYGTLEMTDLLSFLTNHTHLVSQEVERATTPDDLKRVVDAIHPLIRVMSRNGTRIPVITQQVTEINQRLFARLFEMLAPAELLENCSLITMGSEGRKEQILRTDQDNALIIRDGFDMAVARQTAEQFSAKLLDFGFPPCPGGMMISNPKWCKHVSDFRNDILSWVTEPSEQGMIDVTALLDSGHVIGDKSLHIKLRDYLFDVSGSNDRFFAQFAKPIEAFEVPLGLFQRLQTESGEHKGELDLKKGGIFPIVHGARSYCLQHRIFKTNTIKRLHALGDQGFLDADFVNDLIDAYEFMLGLKLRAGVTDDDIVSTNFIRPDELHKLEKDLLKDSLALVKEFKGLVKHHFKLDRM